MIGEAYSDAALVADLSSYRRHAILRAFDLVGCMLSNPDPPTIDRLIRYGAVPGLVKLLGRDDDTEIQALATSAVTGITAGTTDQTKVVIDLGVLPVLVKLLSSPSEDVCGAAVWALGNIAADSIEYRDLVLVHGALVPLLILVKNSTNFPIVKNAAWALSNLCSGKPLPSFHQIQPAIPYLKYFIDSTDIELQADAFMALSDLSGGTKNMIQAIVQTGACSTLVKHLADPPAKSLFPKLTFLVNIMRSGIIDIVNPELMESLGDMLEQEEARKVRIPVCEIIGRIFSGTEEQVRVAVEGGILKRLFDRLQYFIADDLKKEALKAILKAVSRVSGDHLKSVLSQSSVQPLCQSFLLSSDVKVVKLCLKLLDAIMKTGETEIIEANDGFKNIEKLQYVKDFKVSEKVAKILHNHRADKDIAEEEFVWVNATDNAKQRRRSTQSKEWCKFPSLIKKSTE